MLKDFIKEHVPAVVAIAIVIVAAIACFSMMGSWDAEEAVATKAADDAEVSLEMRSEEAVQAERAALVAATGIDMDRVSSDSVMLEDMFDRALTWDSYETYNKGRSVFSDEFGVSEDSWLLKEFMPNIEERENKYGRMVNEIDENNFNLRMSDIDIRCIGYKGDEYDYLVYFVTGSEYRGSEGFSSAVAMVTVGGDGKVLSADAMEVTQ